MTGQTILRSIFDLRFWLTRQSQRTPVVERKVALMREDADSIDSRYLNGPVLGRSTPPCYLHSILASSLGKEGLFEAAYFVLYSVKQK